MFGANMTKLFFLKDQIGKDENFFKYLQFRNTVLLQLEYIFCNENKNNYLMDCFFRKRKKKDIAKRIHMEYYLHLHIGICMLKL